MKLFPSKLGTAPLKWQTGTVTQTLDCGYSYMVQAENSKIYRCNRSHLKPICYDGTSFQDKKKDNKTNSFQDPQPKKVKKSVSFKDSSYMDITFMSFQDPDQGHTPPPSPQQHFSPRSLSFSPPSSLYSSRESSVDPDSGDSSSEGRRRHRSEPTFIRPDIIDRGLTPTQSFSTSGGYLTPCTIQPGEDSQNQRQEGV